MQVSFQDLGEGLQISEILAPPIQLEFLTAPFFELRLYDQVEDRVLGTPLRPADFPQPTLIQQPEGFLIRWLSPEGAFVEIAGTFDEFQEEVALTVGAGLSPASQGLKIHSVRLCLRLQTIADPDDDYCMIPLREGLVVRNPTTSAPIRAGHPGNFLVRDENTDFGILGYLHYWNQITRHGLILRADDVEGRGKIFSLEGAAPGTFLRVELFPENDALGDAEPFTATYPLVLRPLVGEWWDGAAHYRANLERLDHPGLARGPILTSPDYPARARAIRLVAGLTGPHGTTDFAHHTEEMARLAEFFDTGELAAWIASWHRRPQGTFWPEIFPPVDGFTAAAQEMSDLGVTVIPYCYPGPVNPVTPDYQASNPPWSGLVIRAPDQNARTVDLPGGAPAGPPANRHEFLQFSRASARAAMRGHWEELAEAVPAARGWYTDTLPGSGPSNDHALDLDTAARGVGSAASMAGTEAWMQEMNQRFRQGDPEWVAHGEWVNERLLHLFEILSLPVFDITNPDLRYLPLAQTIWGTHVRLRTFTPGLGILPSPGLVPLFAWFQAMCFHRATLSTIARDLNELPDDFLVSRPGEPAHATRWTWEEPLYAFSRRLFVEPHDHIERFLRGRRLRPLPGDYEREIQESGVRLDTSGFPAAVTPIAPPIMTSLWSSGLPGDLAVALFLTNWTDADASFFVRLNSARYPGLDGPQQGYDLDPVTGQLTPGAGFEGTVEVDVPVNARSLRIIVFEPASS